MCAMCHSCGLEVVNLDNVKKSTKDGRFLKSDSKSNNLLCNCGEMQQRDFIEQGGLNPHRTSTISPTTSISSTDSSISSSSDYSVDVNSYDRKEDTHYFTTKKRQLHEDPVSVMDRHRRITSTVRSMKDQIGGENTADIEIKWIGRTQEKNDISQPSNAKMESSVWDLPEPDEAEEDVEGNVAYNDDDEECADGTNWVNSTLLSSISDGGSGGYNVKEEKRRIIEERIKGKLKAIVLQLLKSVAIESSFEDCDSWVDIITSLSWEAASFLKPEAVDSKGMGLDAYVKVKCILNGSRNQSQVVRGLVFKKHAAHKHMPTKYEKPRLLLIQGGLGQSSNELSSFVAMKQGDSHVKSFLEMIELCKPNVILVEKTVSRDLQESILNKGMTLVLDMKLHRLERIARCTGSSIVSAETSTIQKLKQCDSFYFEKFVEEYAVLGEGGKRPSKTLMFLEGCPKCLGCTILLKGSHSEELKMIKSAVHCSVLMAYHLILETSFLVDQRSMLSTIACPAVTDTAQDDISSPTSESIDLSNPHFKDSTATAATDSPTIDIPISNGFQLEGSPYSNREIWGNSPLSYEPYKPVIFSGFSSLSASLKKVIGDGFPLAKTYPSLSAYFGLNQNESSGHVVNGSASFLENSEDVGIEIKDINDELKDIVETHKDFSVTSPRSPSKLEKDSRLDQPIKNEDEVNTVLSQSILVLMSRRNAIKGTICEQSHFSRITFYRDFDIPLGKFLRENILNQRSECSTCGQLPEAHFYYYAHHDKQLTIQVKRLPDGKKLPGEKEGKLWMWSRCGKCKHDNGVSMPTKRVLISSPASVLSFGKFLELSFSHTLLSVGLSSCGHSFQKDFLQFFGLGPVVAMFSYSPVATYTVSMPPQKLEFNSSLESEWLMKEFEDVRTKWMQFFTEVEKSLKMIKSRFEASSRSTTEFFDIEEMLKQENREFELNFHHTVKNGYKLLNLNRLRWEILLESHVWDRRLHSLLSLRLSAATSFSDIPLKEHSETKEDDFPVKEIPIEDHAHENGVFSAKVIPIEELDDASSSSTDALSDQAALSRQNSLSIVDHPGGEYQSSLFSNLKSSSLWFWNPFQEIRKAHLNDMKRGCSPRTEPLSSRTAKYLPKVHQLISEEGSRRHILLGNDNNFMVSDHEGELSSIITCALALLKDQPSAADIVTDNGHIDGESVHNLIRTPSTSSIYLYSDGSMGSEISHPTFSDESRLSSFDGFALLETLFPSENFKAEVSMGVTKSLPKGKYSVVCVFANEFRDLRSCCCPSEIDFIASLSRCRNWDAKGGKSKSFFAKTLDDRFIIKEIKKTEFESFEKIAPHYFKYMKDSFQSRNQTCLAKILGIYQVTVRHPKTGKEVRHDLMVMENLMYGRNTTRQYDLKGALHARFSSGTESDDVLLDQNFVNDMNSSPLYVSNKAKHILQRAVWNDTSFLNAINVMDYSLLVGVDSQKRELVCGIIDYLRQYTWDKQLETWVKSSLVPRNVLPTVISPKEYKKRFRKFMSAHFLCVPDDWCSQESSDSCEICSSDDDHSSKQIHKTKSLPKLFLMSEIL